MTDIEPNKLKSALENSWSKETSYYPDLWESSNPAYGQCTVTALVVQDYVGGDLMRAKLSNLGKKGYHYWNRLPDGTECDFTYTQFEQEIRKELPRLVYKFGEKRSRKSLLSIKQVARRYGILRESAERQLG